VREAEKGVGSRFAQKSSDLGRCPLHGETTPDPFFSPHSLLTPHHGGIFLLHFPYPSVPCRPAVKPRDARKPRTVGVTHHRVLWSPDFPLPGTTAGKTRRAPGSDRPAGLQKSPFPLDWMRLEARRALDRSLLPFILKTAPVPVLRPRHGPSPQLRGCPKRGQTLSGQGGRTLFGQPLRHP
jgi:hypothetical protein